MYSPFKGTQEEYIAILELQKDDRFYCPKPEILGVLVTNLYQKVSDVILSILFDDDFKHPLLTRDLRRHIRNCFACMEEIQENQDSIDAYEILRACQQSSSYPNNQDTV